MNVCVFDFESTGFKGDYCTLLASSIKPLNHVPIVKTVKRVSDDKQLVIQTRDELEKYDIWVSFYGKGFDIRFLRTRLAYHKQRDLIKKFHIDMYYVLREAIDTSRRSLAQYAGLFDLKEKKMGVSPQTWAEVASKPSNINILAERCASDTRVLEHLYNEYKYLIRNINR